MQLSKRLQTIVNTARPAGTAADVGTDHGFVPIALLESGKAERCIASDINEGPLLRAEEHIGEAGFYERCGLRLGPGLSVLEENEAELIVIAGMGGMMIRGILTEGRDRLGAVRQIVLSPHTEAREVRSVLPELGFVIDTEAMVSEEGKFYPVISAVPGKGEPMTERELRYGPVLLRERPEAFLSCLRFRADREKEIIEKIRSTGNEENGKTIRIHEEILGELLEILGEN